MNKFKNVNLNNKAQYLTFTSPIKKNKKGYKLQVNKSFKKINIENRENIFRDVDDILEKFEEITKNYLTFLIARSKYDEQAIKWVFEGTDFLKKDNEERLLNLIEERVQIKSFNEEDKENYDFIYPTTILVGPSGSGKTTFLKQLIGAMRTSFPATSQANTTVGQLYVINDIKNNYYMAVAKFFSEESLIERLKDAYIESLKAYLNHQESDIRKLIYNKFTLFDDKKVKLQSLLTKEDLNDELILRFKEECLKLWENFKKNYNKNEYLVDENFSNNSSEEFMELFNDYIDERLLNIEIDSTINKFINILNSKIKLIIKSMFEYLNSKNIIWEFKILDYKQEYTINNGTTLKDKNLIFELPKMITLKIDRDYQKKREINLQQIFFETMEFVSSAHEKMQGKTLFPLINHIRIKGHFKPLFPIKGASSNYILIDSEGIGHDLTSTTISNELRKIMLSANNITLVQNGSEQMQKAFSLILKTLIYNAWISKTKFCFNRLEKFDANAQNSVSNKKAFIASNIKNVLKDIVNEEKKLGVKIVTNREYIYEDIILNNNEVKNSYYIEFLGENFNERDGFISEDNKEIIESIKIDDPAIISKFKTKFTEEFNPINQLSDYLNEIIKNNNNFSGFTEKMTIMKLFPQYQLDILSGILNNSNNNFVKTFIEQINCNQWQTIKAFNSRIAYNYEGREWGGINPESLFTEILIKNIISYLLNPKNIDEITKGVGKEFVIYINSIINTKISKEIMELVTKKVYSELLENCWKKGMEFYGKDSTWYRKKLIRNKIIDKFEVNNEIHKFNELYIDVREIIIEEPMLKRIKANYK